MKMINMLHDDDDNGEKVGYDGVGGEPLGLSFDPANNWKLVELQVCSNKRAFQIIFVSRQMRPYRQLQPKCFQHQYRLCPGKKEPL